MSLGPGIPLVPFAAPGPSACQALAPFVTTHDAVLLANHGVMAWGADLEQAFLRLELVEHLAKIALVARQVGGPRALNASLLPALLESRRKAGLGLAASGSAISAATSAPGTASAAPRVAPSPRTPTPAMPASSAPKTVVACAPAPPGSDVQVYERKRTTVKPSSAELAEIIRQEIADALRKA